MVPKAPYIDHLHTTTAPNGDNLIFGTTGHTNNHNYNANGVMDRHGKIPLLFQIKLDNTGDLDTSSVIVKELSQQDF